MKRLAPLLALAFAGLFVVAVSAIASWQADGSGSANARALTLPAGITPTTSVDGADVTLSWTQVTVAGSPLGAHSGGGYLITRYADGSSTPITPGPSCSGTISGGDAALGCVEGAVPAGSWRYTVMPVLWNWRGAESAQSAAVTSDADPPTSSISFPLDAGVYGAAGWIAGCGTPGVDDACGTASDATSGVQKVEISIRLSSGNYWGGAAFDSSAEMWFEAGGTTSWSYVFPSTNFPADGQFTIRSRATDINANVQTSPAAATFTIDETSPSIARTVVADSTADAAGFFQQGSVYHVYAEVTDSGSGVADVTGDVGALTSGATSVAMSTTGGPWTIGGQSYNYRSVPQRANASAPESGNPYPFTVHATDTAGNTSSLGGTGGADNTPPATAVSLSPVPNGAGWNKANVTVTLTAGDGSGSGVASITYSAAGAQTIGSTTVTGSSTSFVITTEGTTTISFHATDNVGNVESPDKTQVVKLDTTNPAIARVVVAESTNNSAGFVKASGSYFVYAQASDALSGVATVTAHVSSLSTGGPSTMTTTGGPWTIGGLSYNYRSAARTARSTLTAAGSPYSFSVDTTDTAGNTGSLAGTASVDSTQPTTTASLNPVPNGAGWNDADVTVTLTATDASGSGVASITYSASGAQTIGSTTVTGSSTSFDITTEGTTTISFHATDNVGNVESPDKTQVVKLDETDPAVARVAVADSTTNTAGFFRQGGGYYVYGQVTDGGSGVASVSGDVDALTSGATSVAMTATGGPWTIGGESYNYRSAVQTANGSAPESGNPYSFGVATTDNAGNTSSLGATATVDNTQPATTASLDPVPDGTGWNTADVMVTLTATDGGAGVASVTYSASGAQTIGSTTVAGSSASFVISTDGTTTISFHATDNVGNVESPDDSQVVMLDKNGPAIARAVVADSTATTAGYFTEGGGYYLYAQVADPGSGIASVTGDVGALTSGATSVAMSSGGPWTIGGLTYNFRSDAQTADASAPESGNPYPFTVHATDALSHVSSLAGTANVDNTGPAIARVVVADSTANTASYFTQGGGYYVYAQVTDAGSGVAGVTGDVGNLTTGATSVAMSTTGGPWTIGGLAYNFRSDAQTANAVVPEAGNPYPFSVNATDNLSNAGSLDGTANVDNTAPAISRAAVANSTNNATIVRQGGGYYVYAEVGDGGSGVGAVTTDASNLTTGSTSVAMTTAGGPWTIGGLSYNYRSAAQTAKNPLPESGNPYSLTVTATDNVGNSSSPFVGSVTVDNTAPTATDVQATNDSGGSVGLAQQNDTITFTFSEQMDPGTIKSGWTGSSTMVTVKLDRASTNAPVLLTVWDSAGTTQLALGSVSLARSDYLAGNSSKHGSFTSSSMVLSGATIAITLGTPAGDAAGTAAGTSTMSWTPSALAKDLAGNAMSATAVNESVIVADPEF